MHIRNLSAVAIVLLFAAIPTLGQKPTPTPKLTPEQQKKLDQISTGLDALLKQTDLANALTALIRYSGTGFKDIKGAERDTSAKSIIDPVDDYRRFATKLAVEGAAGQEILVSPRVGAATEVSFVAYYPDKGGAHVAFDQLVSRLKQALGDEYVVNTTYVADDIDDDREGKTAAFSKKNSKEVQLKVVLVDSVDEFDLVKSRVRLVVPGVPLK